jgi:5-oxoprolinase (ATP-hydrolysing) subunit A
MIEINCDLGENIEALNSGLDFELMEFVEVINVACGGHAGDDHIMTEIVKKAGTKGLKIGAHPGFDDKANFGRKNMELSKEAVFDLVKKQVLTLQEVVEKQGLALNHVKPHGALYNMAANRVDYSEAICEAMLSINPKLKLFTLSGSLSVSIAQNMGLTVFQEGFADRTYLSDGNLSPRHLEGAVIESEERLRKQIMLLKNESSVISLTGQKIKLNVDTLCIHGDTPNALEFAKIIWQTLKN